MSSPLPPFVVRLSATFTSEPLHTALEAWLREFGFAAEIQFAPYNQVLQQLLDPGSLLSGNASGVN
ncbi:MAG: hypothetical protein ACPG4K_06025, partial [Haloferula sp.]